jgi:hypothetical protein
MRDFIFRDGKGFQMTVAKLDLLREHEANGAEIVVNKNWRFTGRSRGFTRLMKITQVNDRRSGRPKRIVWACFR